MGIVLSCLKAVLTSSMGKGSHAGLTSLSRLASMGMPKYVCVCVCVCVCARVCVCNVLFLTSDGYKC